MQGQGSWGSLVERFAILSSWMAGGHWQQAIAILEALLDKKVHTLRILRTLRVGNDD